MPVPVFGVVGPQRIKFRIVLARKAAIFHISCYSHYGVDRSVHGQVRREHPALDMLADSVTFRKEAGSQKLTQNDGVAARLPIFFSKACPLKDWDLKDAKIGGGHGTQNHRSAGSLSRVRSAHNIDVGITHVVVPTVCHRAVASRSSPPP